MSLLIATPMYGGQCTKEYFTSCLDLEAALTQNGIKHDWLITTNESLIQRARNTSVARFLKTDFTAFMFIDADIEFNAEDVAKLYKLVMEDGHGVAVGAYPMKREGSDVTAWKDGELVKLEELDGPTPVNYAGTGFMMIHRKTFETLREKCGAGRIHQEGHVGEVYAYFNPRVSSDRWPKDRFYLSEDYDFCEMCNIFNIPVMLDPSIRLGHVGRQVYR